MTSMPGAETPAPRSTRPASFAHEHLSNGEDVYQVGDSCSFLLPLDAAEDAKTDDGQLTVDLDLETWITVYAAAGTGLPEE